MFFIQNVDMPESGMEPSSAILEYTKLVGNVMSLDAYRYRLLYRPANPWCQKSGTPNLDPYYHKSGSNVLNEIRKMTSFDK